MNRTIMAVVACAALAACQKQPTPSAPGADTPAPQAISKPEHVAKVTRSYDGPFGLKAGLSLAEIQRMNFKVDDKRPEMYDGMPPKPLEGADTYVLVATESAGLCKILTSIQVPTVNGTGDQIKAAVDRIAEMMRVKYGKQSSKIEYEREDVYRRNPQFWMMGLTEESVIYAYDWEQGKTERQLPSDIEDIEIAARAHSISSGWVAIRYTFTNNKVCQDEIKAKKASNL